MTQQVTQADREAAWPYRPRCYKEDAQTKERWLSGMYDLASGVPIHAFAHHREAERDRCLAAVDRLKGCEVQFEDRSRFSIAEMNVQHRRTCNAIREEIMEEAVWQPMGDRTEESQTLTKHGATS